MIELFKSKIALNIKGKNINRFIKKLATKKINILSLRYINRNEVLIIIYNDDYENVLKIKSIYEVLEKDTYGYIKIKKNLKLNRHLIIVLILGLLLFLLFTNIIFTIDVIHTNKDIRNLIKEELEKNGIKKYTFKKNYNQLKKIKEKIINDHPEKIEWMEIETFGTKYIVRIEEREILEIKELNIPRNVVAKKDGIIKKIDATKGEIIKNKNDYVKKGESIITGEIILNEKVMGKVKAEGKVYAEVWYLVKTDYPFVYYEEKTTGKKKEVYAIKFLNKYFEFNLNRFKTKKKEEKTIFIHPLLPIKFVKQKQLETSVTNQILTFEEALDKAKNLSIEKVEKSLNKNEYIIKNKYLKSKVKDSTIEVEMFFAVYQDITAYKEIE